MSCAWLQRWQPPMWCFWHHNLKRYYRRRIEERMIRYYDWKLGGIRGLQKLQQNWRPQTPPSSPAGFQPQAALSLPAFLPDSPTKPCQGYYKKFQTLFDD
ncbi:hypothetical protein MPER_07632 [Moniliophthora perniciosa FA553]|nr:hypothetical protein MPER_07632 [Moniliophthora perniciosa FA553]